MKKTLAFVMICMLVFAACSVASASWVSYSGKSLPKISSAITPNVTLGTSKCINQLAAYPCTCI